jgi:hypothetical protein
VLYEPFIGKFISEAAIENCFKQIGWWGTQTVQGRLQRRRIKRTKPTCFWSGETKCV